jgi:hypothetical protein
MWAYEAIAEELGIEAYLVRDAMSKVFTFDYTAPLGGHKIAAIKEFRRVTGCGLKEAKDAVEAIMACDASRHQQELEKKNKELNIIYNDYAAKSSELKEAVAAHNQTVDDLLNALVEIKALKAELGSMKVTVTDIQRFEDAFNTLLECADVSTLQRFARRNI